MTVGTSVELTAEQLAAVETLAAGVRDEQVQTLGGYAGTGKTTVIKLLKRRLRNYGVCAFTGKAANVLRRKGLESSTIHSLIYAAYEDPVTRVVEFDKKEPDELDCRGFIVDEASMVNQELDGDLRSFGLPIIYVGDHGQLEPVGGGNFNLMAQPDITLEQVHRNAGEIALFAEFLRKGNSALEWSKVRVDGAGRKAVSVVRSDAEAGDWDDHDQVICAYNRFRVNLNTCIREDEGGITDNLPREGDRVMCLQNNRQTGLFNGMQGVVRSVDHAKHTMVFSSDGRNYSVAYMPEQFNAEKTIQGRDSKGRLPFDFCYAVTCHKAQGDEWDRVLVYEQRCQAWSHVRWAYTAASRAKKFLTWIAE